MCIDIGVDGCKCLLINMHILISVIYWLGLFNGLSTLYRLSNTEMEFICWIIIITIYIFNVAVQLFFNGALSITIIICLHRFIWNMKMKWNVKVKWNMKVKWNVNFNWNMKLKWNMEDNWIMKVKWNVNFNWSVGNSDTKYPKKRFDERIKTI